MTTKFNPKKYLGKEKLYVSVPNAPRISRVWVWSARHEEYRAPDNQKPFMARRWETDTRGERKRLYRFFGTLEDARSWQLEPESRQGVRLSGPLFRDVVKEWKKRCFPGIELSTRISYENLLRLYFGKLLDLSIHEVTPERIDAWLDDLKDPRSWTMKSNKRTTFKNELKLLTTVLNYYLDYHDEDREFRLPLRPRHRKAVRLNRTKVRPKDLKEDHFRLFAENLGEAVMAALATVQYHQALRISEAAALHWEDVDLDFQTPAKSRVRVARSICWPRRRELESFLKDGFKNAEFKEQPMFPETFDVLKSRHYDGAKGLIFNRNGKYLEYRAIQSAYDRAFKKAGLPYRGTHIMRHGGCRRVYNQEGGDLAVAQQLLGNSDLKSTLVYAKRDASALTEVAQKHWDRKSLRLVASGGSEMN